ncbi:hypothetical protein [Caballeronia sp. GAFFF2]|uniref:hypothetical protein n=1 Tax=Caballeronia sp. GAFFF2 TaxID=2921741 RepID=UPI002028D8BF
MAQGNSGFSDQEIARAVLQLDNSVTLWRRAASASLSDLAATTPLPIRPSGIELAVLTALAQSYGNAIVEDQRFLPVLDFIAECGGITLVQRALWGEQFEDLWLAGQLCKARLAFEILCGTWPDVFMRQAHTTLTRLGLPALVPPMFRDLPRAPSAGEGEGDDEAERDA